MLIGEIAGDERKAEKSKKDKKKKRRHLDANGEDSKDNCEKLDAEAVISTGGKKKKQSKKESISDAVSQNDGALHQPSEPSSNTEQVSENTKKSKKKKHKEKSSLLDNSNVDASCLEPSAQEMESSSVKSKKVKKSKKRDSSVQEDDSVRESFEACRENGTHVNGVADVRKAKKGKRKHDESNLTEGGDSQEELLGFVEKSKKSKKVIEVGSGCDDKEGSDAAPAKRKKKKSKTCQRDINCEGDEEVNHKKEEDSDTCIPVVETDLKAKKKKRKKDKRGGVECEVEEVEAPSTKKKSKKVKSTADVESQPKDVLVSPTKSKPEQPKKESPKVYASCENPPTKPEASTKASSKWTAGTESIISGQWQGDLFDNTDRQNKFMRLLGGMKKGGPSGGKLFQSQIGAPKKGLFGSLTSKTHANTAMSKSAASDLNQKLEDQYNKALNMKLGAKKGKGFGFVPDPAEGKTFHIDVNKTKSIQFDD